MGKYRFLLAAMFFILPFIRNVAATLESNGTGGGDWENASSWDGSNTPADMSDGDTLVIHLGDTITINTNLNFNGVVQVFGVLAFDKGKLNMDSNSVIQLATGSDIIALSSGQNDQIRIGDANNKISVTDINNLVTPNQLTEDSLMGLGCAVTGDCEADPLPVKVLYFRASQQNGRIRLEWCTSYEKDFDFFTIERSKNGVYFNPHAKVYSKTKNSSQNIKYEFVDELPFGGLSYYRLRATDLSGFSEHHGVIAVKLNESGPDILLYPNPVTDNYMMISYSGLQETTYKILNITGIQLAEGILQPGINRLQFRNALESGYYFIKVEDPKEISEKFIVK